MAYVGTKDSTGAVRVVGGGGGGGLPLDAARESKQLPDNHQVSVSNFPAGGSTAALQLPDNHQVSVSNFPAGGSTAALQLPDNHQVTVSNPPLLDGLSISLGKIAGGYAKTLSGSRSIGTDLLMTTGGLVLYKPMSVTVAVPVRIRAGGSANDTAAGSGARSVRVGGVDANFLRISEVIATAGAAASAATALSFFRVDEVEVVDVGTYVSDAKTGGNAADILIETTGGVWCGIIQAGYGQQHSCYRAIAADEVAFVTAAEAVAASESIYSLVDRPEALTVAAPFRGRRYRASFNTSATNMEFAVESWIRLEPESDFFIAGAKVGTGSAQMTCSCQLLILPASLIGP